MTRPAPIRVLHVDDDAGTRRLVARALGGAGCSVTSAEDGPSGLAAALRGRFDLVVLDVDLPGLSGFEVCERLRADPATRAVPLLHLSGARIEVGDRVRGLSGGADAYLLKPVAAEELVAVARALVARGPRARRGKASSRGAARRALVAREDALRAVAQLLRAPLSALGMNARSLAESLDDPVARARATAIAESEATVARAVADAVELAYLESGRALLPLSTRTPAEIAAGAARRVAREAEQAGVALGVDAPAGPTLRCDPERLEGALAVLARHAVARSARGDAVRLVAAPEGGSIRFTVATTPRQDAGVRAPLDADFWSNRAARGATTVLELSLVRAVAAAHGGRAWVDGTGAALHLAVAASPL